MFMMSFSVWVSEPTALQQWLVAISPVLISAVLGPVLLVVMNRARDKADELSLEAKADAYRFQQMEILIHTLQDEVQRLNAAVDEERRRKAADRKRIYDLERSSRWQERMALDAVVWALTLKEILEDRGIEVPPVPAPVQRLIDGLPNEYDEIGGEV